MSGIATAIIGTAVVGGVVANKGAKKAADTQIASTQSANAVQEKSIAAQLEASRYATDIQNQQFNRTQANQLPWQQAGRTAIGQLSEGTADYNSEFNTNYKPEYLQYDPGYQFRLNQGRDILEGSAAARGGLLSGGTLKALTQYGQDMGSQEYGAAWNRYNTEQTGRFNRLASIAGIGQNANNTVANVGANTASTIGNLTMAGANAIGQGSNNISNNIIGGGNAGAAGIVGGANAISGTMQSLGNWYMQNNMMNRMTPSAAPPMSYVGMNGGGGQFNNPAYTAYGNI
jgi:hypothetical protein